MPGNWHSFQDGKSIGKQGSEGGAILRDEHDRGARITLEKEATHAPYAITCGIYGWMVHTRFLGTEPEAQSAFESMREEIGNLVATIPLKVDPDADAKGSALTESISRFVDQFP